MSDDNVIQFPRRSHGEDSMTSYEVTFYHKGRRYTATSAGPTEDIAVERAILGTIGDKAMFDEVLINKVVPV